MSSEIHINHSAFGKPSELADVLVLELSEHGLDLCEWNNGLNQPLYTAHYDLEAHIALPAREQVLSALKHFRVPQKSYQAVYVNYSNGLFTLCPTAFYDPASRRQLLEFNAGPTGDKLVLQDEVNPEIRLIYAIDEQLKSALDLVFPSHHMKHSLCVLSQLMLQSEELAKDQVLAHVRDRYLELVISQDHKLLLANRFAVRSPEDILYYLLFALEQYQLDPATVSLCLAGNTESSSGLVQSLKKYLRHIRLATGHRAISWQDLEGMPQHFNYSLINRIFCES